MVENSSELWVLDLNISNFQIFKEWNKFSLYGLMADKVCNVRDMMPYLG